MMDYKTILIEVIDGIAVIYLNRPEVMNAWNRRMDREVSQAMRELDRDDTVRAIVITGKGKAFCAGSDLSGGAEAFVEGEDKDPQQTGDVTFPSVMPWQLRKPVLAAINGHAIGVGITYAMSCDIRLVARAAKIQFAFVRRGIIPELASHVTVARAVGLSKAADLLLTGRMITGQEMADMGLASCALPAEEVLKATIERAKEFLLAAPVAVAISKRLLWEGLNSSVFQMFRREMPLFEWICRTPDAKEGVAAFLEKRPPRWRMAASNDLPRLLDEEGKADWKDPSIPLNRY
ncbi:MAG TPA: enoyl-CoA hydratase-related protein [Syntrophales bacterium]|nr:enoyl-CoA hydratase-related protein [Syntrophales bacterium]HOL58320.1 enoyl-CoA hydratase-related protein [Syntrophales bacterium]HPO34489.1 enoyl-CoA hydratase-related protein [Syntrophales bacterium]